jgi:long-chain acyl-CoA synthetase
MGDLLGLVKGALVNFVVRNVKKMVPAFSLPGAVRFNDAWPRAARTFKPAIGPDDVAVLQYTGGTTGVSKGAVLLHRNLVANVLQAEAWYQPALMKKIPAGEQIHSVCALPLYHIFALTANMMLGMRMAASNILIPTRATCPRCSRSCPSTNSTASRRQHAVQRAWPTTRTSTRSTGAT